MGLLSMDAATANWDLRYRIAHELHMVKWVLPHITRDETGAFRDLNIDLGRCFYTVSRTAIEIYFEQDGDLTGDRLEFAINEYMMRRNIKPYTEAVVREI